MTGSGGGGLKCQFVRGGGGTALQDSLTAAHGHSHETLSSPGTFRARAPPRRSDWKRRAFTVGVAGPVGSGKTALVLALCQHMREMMKVCVVTNDIFTREDWEFLVKHEALPQQQIAAVETGGCPHAAIREDVSANMTEVCRLTEEQSAEIVFVEAGGDNLAATFSRELADYVIYVVDVAGGDKIPRKGGPGVTQSDLLVINKSDIADAVGASLKIMMADAVRMRGGVGPCVFTEAKNGRNVPWVAERVLESWSATREQLPPV